jgi:hypothetical protein
MGIKMLNKLKNMSLIFIVMWIIGWLILRLHQYHSSQTYPTIVPLGNKRTPSTTLLEVGSKILQSSAPLKGFDIYLNAFHPMKAHPIEQMEAHHYCKQVNEDFAQCVLFDGNTENANLVGIEYIISKKLYDQLPEKEKSYWHPHHYEILSGQLIAPGIPNFVEKILMRKKINSYGKTWHVWMTGGNNMPEDKLPVGPATLAWSFNQKGEINPKLLNKRDQQMEVNIQQKAQKRRSLEQYVEP